MPGNRQHHTDKFRRCVEHVQEQGHDQSSAFAICTAQFEQSGEPIFEGGTRSNRTLVLRGAAGELRTARLQDRDYTVIPVTALLESVIWPVNAPTPEYVPAETLDANPQEWDGRPVVLRHPVAANTHTGANTPTVLDKQGIGTIFGARVAARQLQMEAWIEQDRIEAVPDTAAVIAALRAGQKVEVSVGAFVTVEKAKGRFNGKEYGGIWRDITPDHLAFLPEGEGACSVAMGCGARALVAHPLMVAEGIDILEPDATYTAPPDLIIEALRVAAPAAPTPTPPSTPTTVPPTPTPPRTPSTPPPAPTTPHVPRATAQEVLTRLLAGDAKDITVQTMTSLLDQAGSSWDALSGLLQEVAAASADTPSYAAQLESLSAFLNAMVGSLVAASSVAYCLRYPSDASVTGRSNAGKRHSQTDQAMLQSMHDMVVTLGAECTTPREATASPTPPVRAACSCTSTEPQGGNPMTVEERAALIGRLMTHQHSGFTSADQKMLEAADDARLEAFMTTADARRQAEETRTAQRQTPRTTEEWMASAPPEVAETFQEMRAAKQARKTELIASLKANTNGQYTEGELAAMDLPALEKLAKAVRVEVTEPFFGGRALLGYDATTTTAAGGGATPDVYRNPPDPYAAGINKLRAARGQEPLPTPTTPQH